MSVDTGGSDDDTSVRVSPAAAALAHVEEDNQIILYDPEDEIEHLGGRWISAEATLDVEGMR